LEESEFLMDLANPALLKELAHLDSEHPSGSVSEAAREAIGWFERVYPSMMLGILAGLDDNSCEYVLSCVFAKPGKILETRNGGRSCEELQEWSQREDISPQLRVHFVRRMDPAHDYHERSSDGDAFVSYPLSGILMNLVEREEEKLSKAAEERLLTKPEVLVPYAERLVKMLPNPIAIRLLLAALGKVWMHMEEALVQCMGTLMQQMQSDLDATREAAWQVVGRISSEMRVAYTAEVLVRMLPDRNAERMLLTDLTLAREPLEEALSPCLDRLVRKAQSKEESTKSTKASALRVLAKLSGAMLTPYAECIMRRELSFKLAPKLPTNVRGKYALELIRLCVEDKDETIRRTAAEALAGGVAFTKSTTAEALKQLMVSLYAVDDGMSKRAKGLLYRLFKLKGAVLKPHAEKIMKRPDHHAYDLVEHLPVEVLNDHLETLVRDCVHHDSERVRTIAAAAIKKVNSEALGPHVQVLLSNPSCLLFELVKSSLGCAELEPHVATLVNLLAGGERERLVAFAGLGKLGNDVLGREAEAIIDLMPHHDAAVRGSAGTLALELPPKSIAPCIAKLEQLCGPPPIDNVNSSAGVVASNDGAEMVEPADATHGATPVPVVADDATPAKETPIPTPTPDQSKLTVDEVPPLLMTPSLLCVSHGFASFVVRADVHAHRKGRQGRRAFDEQR
jgi:hypothetical protein